MAGGPRVWKPLSPACAGCARGAALCTDCCLRACTCTLPAAEEMLTVQQHLLHVQPAGYINGLMIKAMSLGRGVSQLSERLKHFKRAEDWQERTQTLPKREGPLKATVALCSGTETQRFPLLPKDWRLTPLNLFCKIRN